jgi:hypothetical protein
MNPGAIFYYTLVRKLIREELCAIHPQMDQPAIEAIAPASEKILEEMDKRNLLVEAATEELMRYFLRIPASWDEIREIGKIQQRASA